jgi:3-hydroxyacyl-CoA dehydrogenase/uncharacterized OB-fold protein
MKPSMLPKPDITPDAEPFWAAAREGRLTLKHCTACRETHYYPRPNCPFCGSAATEWLAARGEGTLYSFSIVRGAPKPIAVAVVALPEGPSLVTTVVDADVHALQIGDPVTLRMVPGDGGQPIPAFTSLAAEQARAYVVQALAASREVPGLARDAGPIDWRRATVIGAGTMGVGIASALLIAGIPTRLIDRDEAVLGRARDGVSRNLASLVQRGRLTAEQVEARLVMLDTSTRMADVAGAKLIIEAVYEQMALKREIFQQIDAHADADAVLGSNTSTLDIDQLADCTRRPEAVIGLHFFSPAHVMPLLEVVRGPRTSLDALAVSLKLGQALKKTAVVVGICEGFVGNRLLIAREREATRLLMEGALPQQIDRVLTEFGLPMGSFELADMAGGIELGYRRRQETGEREPIGDRLFETGRAGQKTGKGYYRYEPGKRRPLPDPEVAQLLEEVSAAAGITRRTIADDEVRDRLILPMINEGAKLVDEGVAIRASDVDVVWHKGYGWPDWKGGPMYHADRLGLRAVRERLRSLAATHGERFRPAALLDRLADAGSSFAAHQGQAAQATSRSAA